MLPGKVSPKLFPYEFTPLYSGIASLAEGLKPVTLGGGYMEPFGLNTVAPSKKVVSRDGSGVSDKHASTTTNRHHSSGSDQCNQRLYVTAVARVDECNALCAVCLTL